MVDYKHIKVLVKHKGFYLALTALLALVMLSELFLRFCLGFCDAPLYQSNCKYEYIAQPCQNRTRFGACFVTNSYSMRSDEPDTTKQIILGLGDSVIFGGTWLDHNCLATTLFSKETGMQMLNISCGSWGPSNCYAYLRDNGLFGAKKIFLVVSSHDAFDEMTFFPVIGRTPNYPACQYNFAIQELWSRYLWPRIKNSHTYVDNVDPDNRVLNDSDNANGVHQKTISFTSGFDDLLSLSRRNNIPLIIYLHAEVNELKAKRYNIMGQFIINWAKKRNVRLIQGLYVGENVNMYKDNIHFNNEGQRFLADAMESAL